MTALDHRAIRPADADVIVIGAGINGLTCAALLAQARLRVLVLEARDRLGGFCATEEIIPGYRAPVFTQWLGPLDAAVLKTLKLQKLGLEIVQPRMGAIALDPSGHHIVLDSHARRGTGGLAQHSPLDAKTFGPFDAAMRKLASGLGSYLVDPPLRASQKGAAARVKQDDSPKTALAALSLKSIGSLAEEYFETPRLQGALSLDAVIGTGLGPRTPGSALTWVERLALETQRSDAAQWVRGGPGALIQALGQAAQASGASVRVNARVDALITHGGKSEGVVLTNGERLYAPVVVASLSPYEVLRWPSARRAVMPGTVAALNDLPPVHGLAKVHLALKGQPQFKGLETRDLGSRFLIAESLDSVERAYDLAAGGAMAETSPLEFVLPSATDATLTPRDNHVLSALIPFAPIAPKDGWRETKNKLILGTIATLARYAPDLPNRVLSAEVETPETMALIAPRAQILWRNPGGGTLHETNPYACAIDGLFFCGAGTHPRLGASGLNGRNCAEAILSQDLRLGEHLS
jgi:phytoene dehydrogenase-like protein